MLAGMNGSDQKEFLHYYLQSGREAVLWKLDGLSDYDVRRPLVPTGTNLLGLVKHLALVDVSYFGESFGRPFDDPRTQVDDDDPNSDLWATAEESREEIIDLYRRVWAHSDATIEALPLDAPGSVAWWPEERREVTLQQILVHMISETHRHAGHADIVRELIDGAAGLRLGNENLPPGDATWWERHHARLQEVAEKSRVSD
jgi:uncharacterized damage-inducible protein DinB